MAKEHEIKDVDWLIKNRCKTQKLIGQVLKALKSCSEQDLEAMLLLVGAVFSLWRSVFQLKRFIRDKLLTLASAGIHDVEMMRTMVLASLLTWTPSSPEAV